MYTVHSKNLRPGWGTSGSGGGVALMPSSPLRTLEVAAEAEGRLDRVLAQAFPAISRSRFQNLIAEGLVTVEGAAVASRRHRLRGGERIRIVLLEAGPAAPAAEAIPLKIVHEDDDVIVVDKPAGLVVHPGPGNAAGTLVNALIAHCGESLSGIGGVRRPGIVHRLDKDTSGLIVAAKNDAAHQGLARQFAAHGRDGKLRRAYLAVVWGVPERSRGTVQASLGRSPANRRKMAVSRAASARSATTHYRVVERFGAVASLLRCELETGRTHQIRVHMAHIGHPPIGDATYGAGFRSAAAKLPEAARLALKALKRQALHAAILGFEHPRTGRPMAFESPLPYDLESLIGALRGASREVE
jgi:23S rRNA pseudouridine1911/1915/1917 synthase